MWGMSLGRMIHFDGMFFVLDLMYVLMVLFPLASFVGIQFSPAPNKFLAFIHLITIVFGLVLWLIFVAMSGGFNSVFSAPMTYLIVIILIVTLYSFWNKKAKD